jgi:hypothetical protein
MPGEWGFVFWIVLAGIPLGLAAATFWARSLRKRRPRVPPGDPGNPV